MNNNNQHTTTSSTNADRSKVILVTGGLGYLGSQLIRDLATAEVAPIIRILDNMQGKHYPALMGLPTNVHYQFVEGDILDPAATRMALTGVETVIHLAAIVRTPMSFEQPQWVEQVNHWGTSHLLEACLEMSVSRFIYTSSTAVYGPGGPFAEAAPCRPQGAYAQSKRRAEVAVQTAQQRGLQTTILRLGTLFGLAPVTRFEAVANRFAYYAGVGRPLTVYGSGQQRRALVHVRDASQAVLFCLTHPADTIGQLFNATAVNASVLELVTTIQALKPNVEVHYTEQDIRTHSSFEANSTALRSLGWQPKHSLETGLGELLNQFRGFTSIHKSGLAFEEYAGL